jgi:hypothetical protein
MMAEVLGPLGKDVSRQHDILNSSEPSVSLVAPSPRPSLGPSVPGV